MILSRNTPCNSIEIKSPRWKQRIVGVASYRVGTHNAIDIIAVGKDGNRYYPNTLYGSGDMIRSCETQKLPSGVLLYLVPIDKLEPLERETVKQPKTEIITDPTKMPPLIKKVFFDPPEQGTLL